MEEEEAVAIIVRDLFFALVLMMVVQLLCKDAGNLILKIRRRERRVSMCTLNHNAMRQGHVQTFIELR